MRAPHTRYCGLIQSLLLWLILILPTQAQEIDVSMNNHPDGNYTLGMMRQDFGEARLLNDLADRFRIISDNEAFDGKSLRVTYMAGEVGAANSGGQFMVDLPPQDEYFLDYHIKFDDNFDFQRGGKIPGLSGGESNSGGDKPSGDGWSARLMWRENGAAVIYLYHMDQPTSFGEDFPLNRSFIRGQWHRITQRVKVNSGNNNDGELQMWFDEELVVLRTDIRFRNNNQAPVDHFFFSTFHGGNTPDWAPDQTGYVFFDQIRIGTKKDEIIPDAEGGLLAQIDRPTNDAVFEAPANISLEASAFSLDSDVTSISFFQGTTELGSVSSPPYVYNWTGVSAGDYSITARASTQQGELVTSTPISITVNPIDPTKGPNLALNQSVTVTSEQEGNLGIGAVDGSTDPNDRWSAQGFPQSITVRLSNLTQIDRAEIVPFSDRAYQYKLDVSTDGRNFNTIVDQTHNSKGGSLLENDFAPTDALQIRLTITGAANYTGTWASIVEFRLFNTNFSQLSYGDINGDQEVSAADASLVLQHTAGINILGEPAQEIADVSGNGSISPLDASLILQYVVGLVECFPVEGGCG